MKRLGSQSKDIKVLREEYEERKKKRSEKNVEEILKSMNQLEDAKCEFENGETTKANGKTSKTNGETSKTKGKTSKANGETSESNSVVSKIPSIARTISIAVPASILDNAQSAELRTYLGGQIARAACIFKVDEVIVFNDVGEGSSVEDSSYDPKQSCFQLARILQYLECPQYLRKNLFPIHPSLQYAGLLNPLDAPHHLRANDDSEYREGIVLKLAPKHNGGSYVAIGLTQNVAVDKVLEPNLRVTVKLEPNDGNQKLRGKIVSPSTPKLEAGLYWGYSVRVADNLSQVFSDCPYIGAYDCTIGTSDKGDNVDVLGQNHLEQFDHTLVVFGGLWGLEAALEADPKIPFSNVRNIFDYYLNTCPNQGSRTIRTEEAMLISLTALQRYLPT